MIQHTFSFRRIVTSSTTPARVITRKNSIFRPLIKKKKNSILLKHQRQRNSIWKIHPKHNTYPTYATKRQQFPPITPSTEHPHLTWNKPFKEAVITAITRAVSGKRKQKLRHPGTVETAKKFHSSRQHGRVNHF